jgi:hypothetical protein
LGSQTRIGVSFSFATETFAEALLLKPMQKASAAKQLPVVLVALMVFQLITGQFSSLNLLAFPYTGIRLATLLTLNFMIQISLL